MILKNFTDLKKDVASKGGTTEAAINCLKRNHFQELIYNFDLIDERLRELAYLNSGIKIILTDERKENKSVEHYYEGGLGEFIRHLDEGRRPVFEQPIEIQSEIKGISNFALNLGTQSLVSYVCPKIIKFGLYFILS